MPMMARTGTITKHSTSHDVKDNTQGSEHLQHLEYLVQHKAVS